MTLPAGYKLDEPEARGVLSIAELKEEAAKFRLSSILRVEQPATTFLRHLKAPTASAIVKPTLLVPVPEIADAPNAPILPKTDSAVVSLPELPALAESADNESVADIPSQPVTEVVEPIPTEEQADVPVVASTPEIESSEAAPVEVSPEEKLPENEVPTESQISEDGSPTTEGTKGLESEK